MKALNIQQPDLFAARGDRAKRPSGAAQLVPRFLSALQGRGWMAGAMLARELQTDLRSLREAAHQSGGLVISGQKGYALTRSASLDDVTRFTNRMYSQAREMRSRALEVERVRHGAYGHVGSAA